MIFRDDDKFRAIVEEYAQDNDLFLEDFRKAWIKLVNADRFGDVCVMSEPVETTTSPTKDSTTSPTKDSLVPQMEVKDMPSETSVTCENSQEASTLTWVLVIVLVVIIFILLAQQFFERKQTPTVESKTKAGVDAYTIEMAPEASDKLGGTDFSLTNKDQTIYQ